MLYFIDEELLKKHLEQSEEDFNNEVVEVQVEEEGIGDKMEAAAQNIGSTMGK